jgi:hypothetical protein
MTIKTEDQNEEAADDAGAGTGAGVVLVWITATIKETSFQMRSIAP